jgi:translation elongation factor EF-1alpha
VSSSNAGYTEKQIDLFRGPTFIEYLDSLPSFNRSIDGPFRMPIVERYKVCLIYIKLLN